MIFWQHMMIWFVIDGVQYKNQWHKLFGNNHPIYIEIGMGKGDFIIENASRYPEINFIGIEKFSQCDGWCSKKN